MEHIASTSTKHVPIAMNAETFAASGHKLVDKIASFLKELPDKPVTSGEQPAKIRSLLNNLPLPVDGITPEQIIEEAAELLFQHSLFNGHPRFWGYITSSATPIGALADFLAASLNANVGAYLLSPMATEIERQTIQWLSDWIGFPSGSSGVFVSGGNMANFVGFLAARKAKANWDIRKEGINGSNASHKKLLVYCSTGTHTWIQKAADLFGLGTDTIRWIDMNADQKIDVTKLELQINMDLESGHLPFLVVGTAGSVSTGSVDDLSRLAAISKQYNLWFHVDGAYGAPAAILPECATLLNGLNEADSIAIDPHKWLYAPLEAGCVLVKSEQHLTDAFSFHPAYYNFDGSADDPLTNYYDFSLQNSRGFRALKVWMGMRQAGRTGYEQMIRKDIDLAKQLFVLIAAQVDLETITQNLSITTFRYVPNDLAKGTTTNDSYLNRLNEALLNALQAGGEVFVSNAIIGEKYCLRVCIVNFKTTINDLKFLIEVVLREGKKLDVQLRKRAN